MNNKASDEWSVGNLRSTQIIVGSRKFRSIPRQRSVFNFEQRNVFFFELYRRRCFYSEFRFQSNFSLSIQLVVVFAADVVLTSSEGATDGSLATDARTAD